MARPYRGPVILKVRIDEALRRRLEAEALRRASTMSQVTRELLHLHLPALPGPAAGPEAAARGREAPG